MQSKILLVLVGLSFLRTVQKVANRKAAITQHKNAVDHKRNENAVAGVRMLNFPGDSKSFTAEVKKVESDLAAFLDAHASAKFP